jgi:hypothetical protein
VTSGFGCTIYLIVDIHTSELVDLLMWYSSCAWVYMQLHLDGGYSPLTYLRLRILAVEKEDDSWS